MADIKDIIVDYNKIRNCQGTCANILSDIAELYDNVADYMQNVVGYGGVYTYKGKAMIDLTSYADILLRDVDCLNKYMLMLQNYLNDCFSASITEAETFEKTMNDMNKVDVETR